MTTKPDDKRPTWEDHAAEVRSLSPMKDANGNVVEGNHLPYDPSDPDGWWRARAAEARAVHEQYEASKNADANTPDYDSPEWDRIRRDHKWDRPTATHTRDDVDDDENDSRPLHERHERVDVSLSSVNEEEDDKESPGEERFVEIVVGIVTTMIVGAVGLLFWAIAPHTIFPVAVFLWGIATWIAGILWIILSVLLTVVLFPLLWLWSVLSF